MLNRIKKFIACVQRIVLGSFILLTLSIGYYESTLVQTISNELVKDADTPEETVEQLLAGTQRLLRSRRDLFSEFDNKQSFWLPGTLGQLIFPSRACGGYSQVFRYIAHYQAIESRIVQMLCPPENPDACHIIVEIKLHDKWYAVDPLYGFRFQGLNDAWLTFNEIGENWDRLKSQAPEGYDTTYNYRAKRYVNWEKNRITLLAQRMLLLIYEPTIVENFPLRSLYYSDWYVLACVGILVLLFCEILILLVSFSWTLLFSRFKNRGIQSF